jgi:siroheme synthase
MKHAENGKVYLVGAGPGDSELLTIRAARVLETTDVVFHDDLVPDKVLGLVHRNALVRASESGLGDRRLPKRGSMN